MAPRPWPPVRLALVSLSTRCGRPSLACRRPGLEYIMDFTLFVRLAGWLRACPTVHLSAHTSRGGLASALLHRLSPAAPSVCLSVPMEMVYLYCSREPEPRPPCLAPTRLTSPRFALSLARLRKFRGGQEKGELRIPAANILCVFSIPDARLQVGGSIK